MSEKSIEDRLVKLESGPTPKNLNALFDALKRVEASQSEQAQKINVLENKVMLLEQALNQRFGTLMSLVKVGRTSE